jgi:hypothetical protein
MAILNHGTHFNLDKNPDGSPKREDLQAWADQCTDEQFTAIHFASYHSNMPIIRILVDQMHCNYEAQNAYGANVVHISAQGDAPTPLYYFVKILKMDLEKTDNRGSTPLHWACYSKSEFALNYIIAMKPNLEIQD